MAGLGGLREKQQESYHDILGTADERTDFAIKRASVNEKFPREKKPESLRKDLLSIQPRPWPSYTSLALFPHILSKNSNTPCSYGDRLWSTQC